MVESDKAAMNVSIRIPPEFYRLKKLDRVKNGDYVLDFEDHGPDGVKLFWLEAKHIDFYWPVKNYVVAIRRRCCNKESS